MPTPNALRNKENAPPRGEVDPLGRETPPHKELHQQTSTTDNPLDPPDQGQPPPNCPRTTLLPPNCP